MSAKSDLMKSTFRIEKMDCPSEENIIRMKLDGFPQIKKLEFDIPERTLHVYHEGKVDQIEARIAELNFNSSLQATQPTEGIFEDEDVGLQRKILWTVLIINFGFFAVEIIAGILAASMGLIGDSLDNLADAIVYGLSLLAVGKAVTHKKQVAKLSGYFQLLLAAIGFAEVVRRFLGFAEMPVFEVMIIVSAFTLVGNSISLYLINKAKSQEAHMQASAIFTSNDIIVNVGVMLAGVLVQVTATRYPDLVIGGILFLVVARGAFRILKLAK